VAAQAGSYLACFALCPQAFMVFMQCPLSLSMIGDHLLILDGIKERKQHVDFIRCLFLETAKLLDGLLPLLLLVGRSGR
jgi:hypothetical protein